MALRRVGIQLVVEDGDEFLRWAKKAEDAQQRLWQSSEEAAKKTNSAFSQIVRGAQREIGAKFVNIAADAGQALVSFFTGSIAQAGQFESTMNRFASVTGESLGESGKSVQDFSRLFIQLGQDTMYSAQQAGDAAVELAKGGLDPATIAAGALADTLSLASAGELALADAATIVAKQLGVWKDTGLESAQVADRLAQAANASTVDVKDLALGLANVGGVAKAAGVSFDETVQTLALLSPGFSSASDAGTSFKTFLASLQPTTKPATEAMQALGLYTEETGSLFYDAQGRFIGMDAATKLLHDSTAGLSEAQRSLQLRLIFGQDAQRAAIMLAEQGAEGYAKMGDSMEKAGSATEQADKKHQGYAVAIQELEGSLETLQIAIGTGLIPALTDLAHAATTAVNHLTTLATINDKVSGVEDRIFDLASSYEDYAAMVAKTNFQLAEMNMEGAIFKSVFGGSARLIDGMTRSQYDFVQSLVATGVPLKDAVEQGKGVEDLAHRFDNLGKIAQSLHLEDTFKGFQQQLYGVAAQSPDTQTKIMALLQSFRPLEEGHFAEDLERIRIATMDLGQDLVPTTMATGRAGAAMERSANQARLYGVNVRGMVQEISQTPEQIEAMEKAIKDADKSFEAGSAAFGRSVQTQVSFFNDLDQRASEHNTRMLELQSTYSEATTENQRISLAKQMQAELTAYASSDQQAAQHYAYQIAAQQQALGEQLVLWISAQTAMGNISAEKSKALTDQIIAQFGIAESSTAVSFSRMTASILEWSKNGTVSAEEFVFSLIKQQTATVESQRRQEALAAQLTGQLTAAYRAGQLSAEEYDAALRAIPAEVRTKVEYDINREQMIKDIDAAQRGAYESGKSVGWNISQGIAAGIASGAVSINPAIVGAVNDAVAAGKRAAGIHSPSKLFAETIGAPITQGIALGITSEQATLKRAMKGILDILGGKDAAVAQQSIGAVSALLDTVKKSFDVFSSLDPSKVTLPSRDFLLQISYSIRDIVADFQARMQEIPGLIKDSSALDFAAKVQTVLSTFSSAIDLFSKLEDTKEIPPHALQMLGAGIKQATELMYKLSVQWTTEGITSAAAFAQATSTILGAIKMSYDALSGVADYKGVASSKMLALGADIRLAIQIMQTLSAEFQDKGIQAIAEFSQNSAIIVGGIKSGVDSLSGIREYESVPSDRLLAFGSDIRLALSIMEALSNEFAIRGLAIVATFSNDAVTIFNGIKTGVSTLDAIRSYQSVPKDRFSAFIGDMNSAIGIFGQLQGQADTLKLQADTWRDTLIAVAAAIKAGVDAVGSGSVSIHVDASASWGVNASDSPPPQARAMGGAVDAGIFYYINEQGVEGFIPKTDGTVLTNQQVTMPPSSQQTANYTYNNSQSSAFTYAPTYNSQNSPPPAMDYAQARAIAQMGG